MSNAPDTTTDTDLDLEQGLEQDSGLDDDPDEPPPRRGRRRTKQPIPPTLRSTANAARRYATDTDLAVNPREWRGPAWPLPNRRMEMFAQLCSQAMPNAEAYRQAYNHPGRTDDNIHQRAMRLFGHSRIRARINFLRAEAADAQSVTAQRIVAELAALGFSDPAPILNAIRADGVNADLASLPVHVRKTISSIEVSGGKWPKLKVTVWDKTKALRMLGEHIRLFHDERSTQIDGAQISINLDLSGQPAPAGQIMDVPRQDSDSGPNPPVQIADSSGKKA